MRRRLLACVIAGAFLAGTTGCAQSVEDDVQDRLETTENSATGPAPSG